MHYFQFNIGDYTSHTRHLSLLEDLAYRRLLDIYYLSEEPLKGEVKEIARQIGMREHQAEVEQVLADFFVNRDNLWFNTRADQEIAHFREKSEKAAKAGRASAERRSNGRSTSAEQTFNQPITNNHKPITNNQISNRSLPKKAGALFDLKEASQGMVHDVWMRKLKDRNITDDEINEAPDVWKRIAVEQCLIWRTEGGHYILRG